MGEKLATIAAFSIVLALVGLNIYEHGKDSGRREAVQAMRCPTNSAYSIIDTRTGKCAVIRGKHG